MLSTEEAIKSSLQYVKNHLKDESSLTIDRNLIDYGDVFLTYINSKEFLDTGDIGNSLIGFGPLVVDKENGFVILYGSSTSEKNAIERFRKLRADKMLIKQDFPEFDYQSLYNMKISKIHDTNKLVATMINLGFSYTIPEIEGDTIWRIPKRYNAKTLNDRFNALPSEFMEITADCLLSFNNKVKEVNLCEFEIESTVKTKHEWNAKRASEIDLLPKW